jgi:RecA-family ATPase
MWSVSQLSPRPVAWLWFCRLALGKLAVLDGDPGLGKSLLALDLCARLSTGRPFPDGTPCPGPANSIVLNGEDGAEDTIGPRLRALDADTSRVFVVSPGKDLGSALRFPTHVDALRLALAEVRPLLVVIDPIMAFLDRQVQTSSDQSVRQALLPLALLANDYGCSMLLNRHLNKTGGSHALYRGGGSIGLIGMCRSGWLVAADPQFPQRRVLAQVKSNLGPPQPGLAFEVVSHDPVPPTLSWLGPSPWAADQLLAFRSLQRAPAPRDGAVQFLAGCLAQGPRTSRDIWAEAQKHGVSEGTLRRAKSELDVRSLRVWAGGQRLSYWLLPGQQLPVGMAADDAEPDLEPWLKPIRDKYPLPTPLDDE